MDSVTKTLDVGSDPGQSTAHLPTKQPSSSKSTGEQKKKFQDNIEQSKSTRVEQQQQQESDITADLSQSEDEASQPMPCCSTSIRSSQGSSANSSSGTAGLYFEISDHTGEETDDSYQNQTGSRKACRASKFLDFDAVARIIKQQEEYNDRKERIYQLLKQRWIAGYLNEEEAINVDAFNQEFLSEKLLQQYGEIDSATGKYNLMLEEFGASLREAVQEWTEEAEAIKSGEREAAREIKIRQKEAQKLFRHINSWADSDEPYTQFVLPRRVVPHEEMFKEVEELYRAKAEEERPHPGTSAQPPPTNSFHQSQFAINPDTNEVRLKSFLRRDPAVCLRPKGAYSTVHPRGDEMLKGLDDTIRMFKFGICPDRFMRELKSIHKLMVLPDFYMKYSDLFFVKRIKVHLWFGKSPIRSSDPYVDPSADSANELGQIILFPRFLKTTNFDINKFYSSIWHFYEILLARLRKPIICEAAQKLLEDNFGIEFNPLHWGFEHMVDYFADCIQKYSNGTHYVTESAPFFLVHSDFAPGLLERSIALEVEKLQGKEPENLDELDDDGFPKIPSGFVPRDANFLDVTNEADFIKPGAYIRCLAAQLYHQHFFFVRPGSTKYMYIQLMHRMWELYNDNEDKALKVHPAYLECSGMFFAVLWEGMLGMKWWHRAKFMCKMGGKSLCKVILVDYGMYITVKTKNLRYLQISFLEFLPLQAIWCRANLPCKTGLPGSEKMPIGTMTRTRFFLAMDLGEIGVHFYSREDPRGPWTVRVDELRKSKDLYQDPHCTTVKRFDLVDYSTWALLPNIQGRPYDIRAKRNQKDKPARDKVAHYNFVLPSNGGCRYFDELVYHPEVIRGVYFGYFCPEYNVIIPNFHELVKNWPSPYFPHKDISNFYDSPDENESENNSVHSDTDTTFSPCGATSTADNSWDERVSLEEVLSSKCLVKEQHEQTTKLDALEFAADISEVGSICSEDEFGNLEISISETSTDPSPPASFGITSRESSSDTPESDEKQRHLFGRF